MRIPTIAVMAFACLVVAGLVLAACDPYQPADAQARNDVDSMKFIRHANGGCFGVVRFTTYAGCQGVSITHVPSEMCAR